MGRAQVRSDISRLLVATVVLAGLPFGNAVFAEPLQKPTNKKTTFSARVIRGPEPLMKEFQNTLPLSPIQGFARGYGFQQAVLSKEQMAEAVRWTEKHKSLSMTTIPQVTVLEGKEGEIEFLKERIAEIPVPQSGIRPVSIQQTVEGIKLSLNSSRRADHNLLKCEWESKKFVSLKKVTVADSNGKKIDGNLPESIKCVRFRMESNVPDGQTLVVSGFTWNGEAKKTESLVLLLEVAPVEIR